MKFVNKRRFIKRILFTTLILALLIFSIIFLVIPIVYKSSYAFQRSLVFLNFVNTPVDFKHPRKLGLEGTRNFYLNTNDNVTLGVWHVLPASRISFLYDIHKDRDKYYDKEMSHGETIILYMHGNSGNRGSGHRIELYKVLQKSNLHVVAFDYRSYGDSSPVEPSELGVVSDSKTVYEWVKSRAGKSKIIFWGHSLGTGISSHLVDILENSGEPVTGLILEAPFNNMRDEVRSYPLAKFFSYLPWFDYFFTDPMHENGLIFESDQHLKKVKTPVMILHAQDDMVIPIKLGKKLYEDIRTARNDLWLTKFVQFNKTERFGHKFIYKAKNLNKTVLNFIEDSSNFKRI